MYLNKRGVRIKMSGEKQCAYCHTILFDDDDVVYCPECGAPHHRECYNKLGHCAREQLHGTPEAEQPHDETQAGNSDNPDNNNGRPHGVPLDREGHICKKCGQRSTSDTLFCPYCGTPFADSAQQPYPYGQTEYRAPFVNPSADPYGGVDPSSSIDGVPASELASYVRNNSNRYIPVFSSMAARKKSVGWNWSAFLFSYGWFFYRKCYIEGFVSILFTIISYIMTAPYFITVLRAMSQNGVTGSAAMTAEQYAKVAEDIIGSITPFALIMLAAGIILLFVIHLVAGMFADRLYLNHAKAKIQKIKADDRFEDKISAITISGGVNIITATLIVYIMLYFVFQSVIYMFY